jgi:hypothetical protein
LGYVKTVVLRHGLLLLIGVGRHSGFHRRRVCACHGCKAVLLQPVHVELRISSPLLNEAGVRSVSYGLAEEVVPELGELRAWWVLARSVRLNW